MRAFIFVFTAFLCFNSVNSQDYNFYKTEDNSHFTDIEFHNEKIYLLNSFIDGKSIKVFDAMSNTYETLISKEDLNENGLANIEDMVFLNDEIFVIKDNKLINISDGYKEYSLSDEFDFKPYSDKYRELHNITAKDNSLFIGSTYGTVKTRDTLYGTPFYEVESYGELLKFESGNITRVFDGGVNKDYYSFDKSPVIDENKNIWFAYTQNEPNIGGVIKINSEFNVEIFDLKSNSGKDIRLQPISIDLVNNSLYVSSPPSGTSAYVEGLSIYNIDEKNWSFNTEYLENYDGFEGRNWEVPRKVKQLNNGDVAILGLEFTIQHENSYTYFNITEMQQKKYGISAKSENLDLYETEDKYYVIRRTGILEFDKSAITSVNEELSQKYDYQVFNNSLNFSESINSYRIFDLLGKPMKKGGNESNIDISELNTGAYFILLNKEYMVKFIKE
ncbi:MAG: T9SS type A sorting domain-containing protein [Chlorobiota bacterium]